MRVQPVLDLGQSARGLHSRAMPKFARILLDNSGGRVFDYGIPDAVAAVVAVGSRVRVSVRMRALLGTVIAVSETTEAEGIREISEVLSDEPAMSAQLIRLAEWVANYYCCPLVAARTEIGRAHV